MIDATTDKDGICTLVLDQPARSHNLLDRASTATLRRFIEKALTDPKVIGIVITSAKKSFLVGADLDELWSLASAAEAADYSAAVQDMHRLMETGGKAVVAALNGSALGGGFELALACHHRIAADLPDLRVGLPEATLGLLPGGGGTQRLPRLIGIEKAAPLLLKGIQLSPSHALEKGLIDELCAAGDLVDRAKAWILSNPQPVQPWDRAEYKASIDPRIPEGAASFLKLGGDLRASTWRNDHARHAILACIYESAVSTIDTGLKVEQRRFAELMVAPATRNIIRTTFFHTRQARHRATSIDSGKKVAVLGAGMMGAGIATVCANAGYKVMLVDRDQTLADGGKAYAEKVLGREVGAGVLSESGMRERLDNIVTTADLGAVRGCEIAIEAVFEDREVKADIYRAVEEAQGDILLATNTSTLPIAGLAKTLRWPDRFIGLHFFSPVDRMPLVEVIPGMETSPDTLARALAFIRRIRKVPIVVQDERGFFTSRVFSTYVREGLALLTEGVPPALIEHGGRLAGMPVGPLTVVDEVSAATMLSIQRQNERDLGEHYKPAPGDDVLAMLVDQLDRRGKKYGRGLYDYPQGERKRLWPGLAIHFPVSKPDMDVETVIDRLLGIQAVEAVRCLEEGVIASAADGDLGSVLGWNYPASVGGALAYIDGIGARRFVECCNVFAERVGARFSPPAVLKDMAISNSRFHEI
ncbi:MAG: enoyl-CoA hydratase/isomerase family protein [Sphingomonadales bacterium]|nr:enoyl-CoA hydratase/isomerase family protein [Sphingomonadales bacterium]